ncbi:tRNA/rRNA methyltransferase YfiF [Salmonella enterica subsp. arizonae]|uniref:tRNA/rRNA methyltransferase YfiF n=1 Tax=Salmonella enterica subsp. arizonae TaxID=59203 RepID=A0A3S4K2A2_SALER|nr:tRNA/rRNA methyltransferase YfiF [Salmonella enterica subsp. arizonae]
MNDELKNKSGKVKVMYVRSDDDSDKRTHNPRTGKGGGRPAKSRTDGGRRPARDERNNQIRDRKHETSPWRTVSRAPGDEAPEKVDHGGISGKSLSTLKFCVASVRKRRASTAKMPARRYSRAVLTPSCAHGLSKA